MKTLIRRLKRLILQTPRKSSHSAPLTHDKHPEAYWVQRKQNVIGQMSVDEILTSNQADTYNALVKTLLTETPKTIVDLGCNISAVGQLLLSSGYTGQYTGVDFNLYGLRQAATYFDRLGFNKRFVRANVRQLPFKDATFTFVVMKDVIEHMEDFRPFVAEAARVAKDGIIISTFILWTEGETIIRREPPGYYHNMYNRFEVVEFCKTLGFSVSKVISCMDMQARPNEIVLFKKQ